MNFAQMQTYLEPKISQGIQKLEHLGHPVNDNAHKLSCGQGGIQMKSKVFKPEQSISSMNPAMLALAGK